MVRIGVFVPVFGFIFLGGCASVSGFPRQIVRPAVARNEVAAYLTEKAVSDCNANSTRQCRNQILDARLRAIDIEFGEYERALYREGIGFGVGTDWLAIALNTIGSVTNASKPLAAASAGVLGARASYEKQALYNLTLPVMLAQMQAKRKEVLVHIRGGENQEVSDYSIYRGLNDIDDYAMAGSVPGAMNEMVTNAGVQAKEAKQDLDAIVLEKLIDPVVQKRREPIANTIKAAQTTQLELFLRLSGQSPAPNDEGMKRQALDLLDAATNPPAVDTLCDRLKAAMSNPGGC